MRRAAARSTGPRAPNTASALLAAGLLSVAGVGASAAPIRSSSPFAVPAARERLTTDDRSPVVHDNEVMALVAHSGRLFAATDQWEYAGAAADGQVLVKDSGRGRWRIFERTRSRRVQALDSFPIPAHQGLGRGHSLLISQAITGGRSRVQWLLDGARSFTLGRSLALASLTADVRAFGAHESGGVWAVYAGVSPTGILQGKWSRKRHTLVFNPKPELTVARPGSPGLKSQKVTGFADCAGSLYVSIDTKLFRRNDGHLSPGAARWVLVYQAPPVGPDNSGLRGLTCVTHDGSPSLLVSTEGTGNVYRFDHLPGGQLRATSGARGWSGGFVQHLELSPFSAIRRMLAVAGTTIPTMGRGSIGYVIAAYNNFTTLRIGGVERQAFGFEWNYRGLCPPSRACQPGRFFDAAACFGVRTDHGPSPSYVLRCLGGRQFAPSPRIAGPVRAGQAFVSIRTIALSPFGDGRLYYGGYDCNFSPADGTAWIASSTSAALDLPASPKGARS